ncbi:MAG: universal stress protein [Proteobacteria bacterium]|nr:universal stress protein [Pseudomonadota bacterium]
MFNKILFPVDLSPASLKICPYVKEVAQKFQSEIHVVYVVHVSHYYSNIDMSAAFVVDFETEVRKGADKKFNDFVSANFSGLPVQSQILSGRPIDEIMTYVKSKEIDLVVMGHSSTGIERAIFGSVAGHMVKYSPVPVMVISPDILNS